MISIIALLIAILLPALKKARSTAESSACLSNLRQIAIAATAYGVDYDGRLPAKAYDGARDYTKNASSSSVGPVGVGLLWAGGYHTSINAFYCPGRPAGDRLTRSFSGPGVGKWDANNLSGAVETSYYFATANKDTARHIDYGK